MKKIECPKDWEGKLVNTEETEVSFSNESVYSITPRTLKKVGFKEGDSGESIFIEKYEFEEKSVTRFGINIYDDIFREQLDKELSEHNDKLKSDIERDETKTISNISGTTKYREFSKHIQLTNSENCVLKIAIDYMFDNEQKVVLVDVFKRESKAIDLKDGDGKVQISVGGINPKEIDTHTVLLYKADEDKILAIDPNNPMFSCHLSKFKYTNTKNEECSVSIETLCSTDEKYKIYSRSVKSSTGFASDKFRDCVDIAVKMGLLLSVDSESYKTIEEIMSSECIKLITNNSIIDKLMFTNSDLIRQKQSSDIKKIMSTNKSMKKISIEISEENQKYESEKKELESHHFDILKDLSQSKSELIGELKDKYNESEGV